MKYGERKGDWMQTYTGRQFWPLDPRPEEIFIEDIAHALSMTCRYGGHCEWFYSVAQHSVAVMHQLEGELALWGLMHDAAEAYLVDLPRPIKRHMYEYLLVEEQINQAVAKRFGFPCVFAGDSRVKNADNAVMLAERQVLMKKPPLPWHDDQVEEADIVVARLDIDAAKFNFLAHFYRLGGRYVV